MVVNKSKRATHLDFWALWDCSKFPVFCLILGFLNKYPAIVFSNTVRVRDGFLEYVGSKKLRYT